MRTEHDLRNNTDWDIIKLNVNVDIEQLAKWYNAVESRYSELKFNLSMVDLIKPQEQLTSNVSIVSDGVHSFGMSWPVEQSLPIPPKFACKAELYPEIELSDFEQRMQVMERYKFGYFNNLLALLGEDTFAWSRITVHDAGASIGAHTDGKHSIRLHIPIITNDSAWFCWGEKKYNLKPGYVYLINTSIEHYTINSGNSVRAHIISHPTNVTWLLENLS